MLIRSIATPILIAALLIAAAPAHAAPIDEFNDLLAQWQANVQQLQSLRSEYAQASPDQKQDIEQRFNDIVTELRSMEAPLLAAAEEAYKADPNANPNVNQHLLSAVQGLVGSDRFDQALDLARLLIENDFPNAAIHDLAGVAAFATNRFDAAQKHFDAAKEAGALSEMGRRFAPEVQQYQQYWARENQVRQAEAEADDLPRVKLETSAGDITLELYEDHAPNTVANFIHLVQQGFYDDTIFHRVLPNFMAQGGDPTGTGGGGPGWAIECECYREDFRRHFRGTISMAHAGRDTGGSQFFLTFLPTPHLDGKHTAFGRVVDGMEVLAKLQKRNPRQGGASDRIVSATVLRKRDHEYVPEKLPDPRQ